MANKNEQTKIKTEHFCFLQTILYIAVIFTCSSPSCTNCLPLEKKESNEQSHDQQTHLQDDAFQPENIKQENEVRSRVKGFLDAPSAHNRTTRDANPHCVEKIVREWDTCRKRHVDKFFCLPKHAYCSQWIAPPKCKTVYGYPRADSAKTCPMVAIDCQCAL